MFWKRKKDSGLELLSELSPARFAEVGRLEGGFRCAKRRLVALVSELPRMHRPGLWLLNEWRRGYRLSLYTEDFGRRLAVLDAARFPIHDVSFHPTLPLLALGTGSYDGGYLYEGQLLLWNWETGVCRSLLQESREVVRCRFEESGQLSVLLRPRDEEEFDGDADVELCLGVVLGGVPDWFENPVGTYDAQLDGLVPIDPSSMGFDAEAIRDLPQAGFTEVSQEAVRAGLEERHSVWDLAWTDAETLAVVHACCQVETWRRDGERIGLLRGESHGVQLLPVGDEHWVHLLHEGDYQAGVEARSSLKRLASPELSDGPEFDRAFEFSVAGDGTVLCRDPGGWNRPRADMLIRLDAPATPAESEGAMQVDCAEAWDPSQKLRLDGGPGFYWLESTPSSLHPRRKLFCWTPVLGRQKLWDWDPSDGWLSDSLACWGPKGDVIRAYTLYRPGPGPMRGFVGRLALSSGVQRWCVELPAAAVSMLMLRSASLIVCGLADGSLALVDAERGTLRSSAVGTADGPPSVVTALAAQGTRIAAGTDDGRVMLYELG